MTTRLLCCLAIISAGFIPPQACRSNPSQKVLFALAEFTVHITTSTTAFRPGFYGLLSNNSPGLLWSEMLMMGIGANLRECEG